MVYFCLKFDKINIKFNNKTMLPFGKYKNTLLEEVIKNDEQYLKWLNTQPWFKIKNKDLHLKLNILLIRKERIINKDNFIIYTDGACSFNGTPKAIAGIGIHFSTDNNIKLPDISKKLNIDRPTNNKAELYAIKEAIDICRLKDIKDKIIIFTDSDYSIKCITVWYPIWLKNKDLNKKNINIISEIVNSMKFLDIEFEHIYSHTNLKDKNSVGNHMADQLATKSINKI